MKVSLNIVRQFIDFDLPPIDELVERVNQRLGQVEEVINLGEKYKDVRIVKVVECEKHPNADKLSVTKIDDGGVVDGVERDENGLIQVVCGAPNAKAGMWAAWLPPNSVVPETFDDVEPFCLLPKELRGVVSNGMLASERELGLGDNHQGIIDLSERDLPGSVLQNETLENLKGTSFAEVFGLDGYVIDIENKMFTHRPDLFGQLGVAREISAIFEQKFTSPDEYLQIPKLLGEDGLDLEVTSDTPEASKRFMATVVEGVDIDGSPMWLKCQLVAMGAKPINNIVDITNYVMLMSAQPTHAYDYDKLRGQKLGVRFARPGEKAELLNGKTYQLDGEDIVIVDGDGVIGLAGVMGGLDTEVTDETKNVVFEVANFDMYRVRKTSMRHGIFTDAVTRFTKGQSPAQIDRVTNRILSLLPSGRIGKITDATGVAESQPKDNSVAVGLEFINQRLGGDFTKDQIVKILELAEFRVSVDASDNLIVEVPFWRTDIELPEDVVEEVGRLFGFDKLPRQLPVRTSQPAQKNQSREIKQKIRDSLSRAGANETLNYSFVHEKILTKARQDPSEAYRLSNALSPDLQYYRLSVLPSLLDKVYMNIRAGHDEFMLFEVGKGHNKNQVDDEGLPLEKSFVDLVYASKKPRRGAAYFHVRRVIQQLALDFGFSVVFSGIDGSQDDQVVAPFESSRSAIIQSVKGDTLGVVGEFKQEVSRNFKLPEYSAGMTLDFEKFESVASLSYQRYAPLSVYPATSQDVSLKLSVDKTYREVFGVVYKAVSENQNIETAIEPVSIYQAPEDGTMKTITLRIRFVSHDKTLSDKDIAPIMNTLADIVAKKLDAAIV